LRQKSIISSSPASACARAVGAPHTDSQYLPVSELLIISTLATAKPRAEPEADSKHFDIFGAPQARARETSCPVVNHDEHKDVTIEEIKAWLVEEHMTRMGPFMISTSINLYARLVYVRSLKPNLSDNELRQIAIIVHKLNKEGQKDVEIKAWIVKEKTVRKKTTRRLAGKIALVNAKISKRDCTVRIKCNYTSFEDRGYKADDEAMPPPAKKQLCQNGELVMSNVGFDTVDVGQDHVLPAQEANGLAADEME
jgi:hypothetical protein